MLVELVTFTEYLLKQDLARSTVRTYLAGLRIFARWWDAQGRPLRALTSEDVERFVTWRLGAGASAASVNRTLLALRHFCRWAKRRRRLGRDPMAQVSSLPVPRSVRLLTTAELAGLLDVVRRDRSRRDRSLLLLMMRGGLRPSQLIRLRRDDVTLNAERGELRIRLGRTVPAVLLLDQELTSALHGYLERRGWFGNGRLFLDDDGQPLTTSAVEQLISSYARAAGLAGLTWRTLSRSLSQAQLDAWSAPVPTERPWVALARRVLAWPRPTAQAPALS